MSLITSHVLTDIVHGGYDDAASLTLWVDREARAAHLTGHSGSMQPLDGPLAPEGAIVAEATGTSGMCTQFDADQIAELLETLEPLVERLLDAPNAARVEAARQAIEACLEEVDLAETSYESWIVENDPETWGDLYEDA